MLRPSSKIEALSSVPLFRELGRRDLALVARYAEEKQCEGGDFLTRQGEFGRDFILIVDGSARVERDREVVAHLGNGDFLGDMSLLDGEARSATVTTETPSSILIIHGDDFERILEAAPTIQRQMLRVLSKRIRALDAMYTVTVAESRKPFVVGADTEAEDTANQVVDGLLCKRGHFNHPQVTYCSACGVSMLQAIRQLVKGYRPSVGILLRDDGATFTVDSDYVIGSSPESAESVRSGQARALRIASADSSVGEEHALIHLEGWSVRLCDLGSGAGTSVRNAEAEDWVPLPSGGSMELATGARILIGESVLTFASTLLR